MTEREELLEEAKSLGLEFAKNAKTDNIRKAVEQARLEKIDEEAREEVGLSEPEPTPPTEEEIRAQLQKEFEEKLAQETAKITANIEANIAMKSEEAAQGNMSIGQAKLKARREAMKLVRVNVTCKDPLKQSWEGEIISAGNDVVGDVKKYIPFNTEDGYHIPQIILNALKEKTCTIFVKKRINGQTVNQGKQVKAYNIEELPPLTVEELEELARDQAARQAID